MLHVLTEETWDLASASPSTEIEKQRALHNSKYKNPAQRTLKSLREQGLESGLLFFSAESVARFAPQPLDLVFQLQLLLLQSPDLDVVRTGTRDHLIDPLFKGPVLFREFCKMSHNCHHSPPKEIADMGMLPHVRRVVQRLHDRLHHI
jgi:hypothetical protein